MPRVLLSLKAPQKYQCGGPWTGCDELHNFHAPQDLLVIDEAVELDDMCEEHFTEEKYQKAQSKGTLYYDPERKAVIPTMLGMWLEDAASN